MSGTARYAFEDRIRAWAEATARRWTGGRRAFFVGLRDDGVPRRIYFAPDESFDAEQKATLAEGHSRWFLYLPHTDGTYLEWLNVGADDFARWMGEPLGGDALSDRVSSGSRGSFPDSWRVIFQ